MTYGSWYRNRCILLEEPKHDGLEVHGRQYMMESPLSLSPTPRPVQFAKSTPGPVH